MVRQQQWAPSLFGSCQEEPGIIEKEVFEMLDSNKDGFLSLQELQPLRAYSAEVIQAVGSQMRRCRNPVKGLCLYEFAAAFREETHNRVIYAFYKHQCGDELHSPAPPQTPPHAGTSPCWGSPPGWTPRINMQQDRTPQKAQSTTALLSTTPQSQGQSVAVLTKVAGGHSWRREECPSLQPASHPKTAPPASAPNIARHSSLQEINPGKMIMQLLKPSESKDQAAPYEQASDERPASTMRQRRRTAPAGVGVPVSGPAPAKQPWWKEKKQETARRWVPKQTPVGSDANAVEEVAETRPRCLSVRFDGSVESPDRPQHTCLAMTPERGEQLVVPETTSGEQSEELRDALAEIERLKSELAAAKEESDRRESFGGRRRRHSSMDLTVNADAHGDTEDAPCAEDLANATSDEEDEEVQPLPPDNAQSWDWPLSRHEKKSRIHLIERQMHALDRKTWIQERRLSMGSRGVANSCCDSDSEGCEA